MPANTPEDVQHAHREKLVWLVRLLLASVGIRYHIGTKDEELDYPPGSKPKVPEPWKSKIRLAGNANPPTSTSPDFNPHYIELGWSLEGYGDKWLARGIRNACGFQLSRDPEEAAAGKKEAEELAIEAAREVEDDDYF